MCLGKNGTVTIFLAILLLTGTAIAKTVAIPPPSSAKKNNATRNVVDVINTLRKRGHIREANQLQKLLRTGRMYYRTTGKHKLDAQFVHGLTPRHKDTFYYGIQHVKHVPGKGAQRYQKSSSDRRRLYLTILTSLHEMVHKDQGRVAIAASETLSGARGYSLHEIEAYRVSLKKYARTWVVNDVNAYLRDRESMTDKERFEALSALRQKLFPLENAFSGTGPGAYGDKVCRWAAIRKEVTRLSRRLDALWLDYGSRVACLGNLKSGDPYKQHAIETELRSRGVRKAIRENTKQIGALKRKIRTWEKAEKSAQRKLTRTRNQSRRLELASKIQKHRSVLEVLRKQLAEATRERATQRKQLRSINAKHAATMKTYKTAVANFNQCRVGYVKSRMVKYKLKASQLPADMRKTARGGLKLTRAKRTIDLAKPNAAIEDMFRYTSRLLSATEAARHKDPRTPCYKAKTASRKPTPKASKGKRKKTCRGSGLVGRMDCVGKRIERGH
jgi:hypothetical protein